MFAIKNISKSIGSKVLFENISFSIASGERIALVGPNGSGKSTMLNILAGFEDPDTGSIALHGERIAHVPQELVAPPEETIGAFCKGKEHEILSNLKTVGMGSLPLTHLISSLSGGQKTRVLIAKALLAHPTILLLDEPTNHLDREGVDWFLDFLHTFHGTIFTVSHDRELLNEMTRIFEIDPDTHSFEQYLGGWHAYKEQRAERMSQRLDAYENQQKEKERLEDRLKWRQAQASSRSNPVLGAQVRMMKRRIEREITSQEIARPYDSKTITNLSLAGVVHDAKLLLAFKDVSFARGEKTLLRKASFEIRGKERVVLTGKNGSGKSTLLKTVMGLQQAYDGEIRIGANVRIGYFAQEHESLDPEETVLESFENTERRRKTTRDSRSILAAFLFVNNALQKKIRDLSPGERVRLIFAKLMYQENELLLLDEPTNHLDIESKEVIETALAEFEGGVLTVSHDPYFTNAIGVTRELRIEKGELIASASKSLQMQGASEERSEPYKSTVSENRSE